MRKLILDNTLIKKIIIISNVFKKADVNNAIIVLEKNKDENLRKENYIDVKFCNDINELVNTKIDYTKVFQGDFYKNKNFEFNLLKKEDLKEIFNVIESRSINLGEISRINFGLQTPNRKLYPDSVKIIENKIDVVDPYRPCITGKDINYYQLNFKNRYVYYDINTRAGGCWDPDMHFNNKKLIVRQIGNFPIAALDNFGYACLNTVFMIVSTTEKYNIEYILALLNSNLIKFYWHYNFSDYKTLFPKIKKTHLKRIPIYSIDQQNEMECKIYNDICSKVKEVLELFKKLNKIKLDFFDYMISVSYKIIRLSKFLNKIENVNKKYYVSRSEKVNFTKLFVELKDNQILISELNQKKHKKLMEIEIDDENLLKFLFYILKNTHIKGKFKFINKILNIEIPEYNENLKENTLEITKIVKKYNDNIKEKDLLESNIKINENLINQYIYRLYNFNSEMIDLIEKDF